MAPASICHGLGKTRGETAPQGPNAPGHRRFSGVACPEFWGETRVSDTSVRIDGWKAIAAHFRRDRSTVMRWANGSDFPIRRGPGQKSGSVWAYAHELDAWLTRNSSNGQV